MAYTVQGENTKLIIGDKITLLCEIYIHTRFDDLEFPKA